MKNENAYFKDFFPEFLNNEVKTYLFISVDFALDLQHILNSKYFKSKHTYFSTKYSISNINVPKISKIENPKRTV